VSAEPSAGAMAEGYPKICVGIVRPEGKRDEGLRSAGVRANGGPPQVVCIRTVPLSKEYISRQAARHAKKTTGFFLARFAPLRAKLFSRLFSSVRCSHRGRGLGHPGAPRSGDGHGSKVVPTGQFGVSEDEG
jgi:hypothetical protein